jgi:hypothetical protein
MKRAKVVTSTRLVRHGERSKTVLGLQKGDPYFLWNLYDKKYEVVIAFADEFGNEHRVVADRLDLERLIAKIQFTIKTMPIE